MAAEIERMLRSEGRQIVLRTIPAVESPMPRPTPASAVVPNPERTVEDLFRAFLADSTRERTRKTEMMYETPRDLVIDVWGASLPVACIDRDACRDLMEVLRTLPTNPTKRFPEFSALEASRMASETGLTSILSIASVNGYLMKLRAVLNFAVNEEWIGRNPARGLRIADPVRAKDKRLPFSPEQLRLIFDAPLYRGCQDDEHGYAVVGPALPRRGRFWVPLLSLFAGLRLNEACQLDVADVRRIRGVDCLAVTAEGIASTDKRLKTSTSERVVPLHPCLRQIGFLDFADSRRRGHGRKLFPELTMSTTGYYSDPYSKWFRRFLVKAGADRPRTCFHSFRHNYRDALRDAGVGRELALALGGWAGASESGETHAMYGSGFDIQRLAQAVSSLTFRGLDLAHLGVPDHRRSAISD
jgi:integrase